MHTEICATMGSSKAVRKSLLMTFILAILLVSIEAQIERCFRNEVPKVPNPNFSKGVAKFSLGLFKRVASKHEATNRNSPQSIFISPYSIWSALTLAYFGSEGRTAVELERVLKLSTKISTYTDWKFLEYMMVEEPSKRSGSATLKVTNNGYFSNKLIMNKCLTDTVYEMKTIDFSNPDAAARIINNDVSAATEGKIDNLVDAQALANTRFVLVNAVFFMGNWQSKFDPANTYRSTFTKLPGSSGGPQVDMMIQTANFQYASQTSLDAHVLELPYSNSALSMYLILPYIDIFSPTEVLKKLTLKRFNAARSQMTNSTVRVSLPKFQITTSMSEGLEEILVNMGASDLFSGHAELTAFATGTKLKLDTVVHKAMVEVTEEGTVAAAVTGLFNTRVGPLKFACDRPFIFLITDSLMEIPIFAGIFNGPS